MSMIKKLIYSRGTTIAFAIFSFALTIIPEGAFETVILFDACSVYSNIAFNRTLVFVGIFVIANLASELYSKNCKSVSLTGGNYSIKIEYGNLFAVTGGKVVINFDECFTTQVGDKPCDIKESSVCGQYLVMNPIDDIQSLIDKCGIKPAKGKSAFNGKVRYDSGTIIPNGDYFLMAFAKLDKAGRGYMTYADYIRCLDNLWKQIDLYHGTDDVYLPVLGARITRLEKDLTQQQLLDIMVGSYCLSPYKLKNPCTLHIVCTRQDGFSLGRVRGID